MVLPVSLYGTHLGHLSRSPRGARFTWSTEAEARWGINSPVLSQHLVVGSDERGSAESYFGALLPEGQWLERLARRAAVASSDLVGLFAAVGADLAGALVVGSPSTPTAPQKLEGAELALVLDEASNFLVGGGGTALPGFQQKVTLTRRNGRWLRGNSSLPSTHILKPVSSEQRPAAEAEAYVLALAHALDLAPYESWVEDIAGRPVLVIERYDRTRTGDAVERIHQEDSGQALGLPWGGNEKFESNDPNANLAAVAALLDRQRTLRSTGESDRERLLRYTTLSVAAGNSDAHAKNFSLLHDQEGRVRLAPYYDAAPLALSFDGRTDLAMRIAGVTQLPDVTVDHLVSEAQSWGIRESVARELVANTLERLTEATRTLPAHESIRAYVPGYIRGQTQNLLDGKPARITSAVPLMALPFLGTAQPRGESGR